MAAAEESSAVELFSSKAVEALAASKASVESASSVVFFEVVPAADELEPLEAFSGSYVSAGTEVEAAVAATAPSKSSDAWMLVDAVTALLSSL